MSWVVGLKVAVKGLEVVGAGERGEVVGEMVGILRGVDA